MKNPFTDFDVNAKAQLSIVEACRNHNPDIRIVFASTRQIYGKPQYLPVDEQHPSRPVDINGVNKMAGECYHILYNNFYDIPASILRLTNTYGPRMQIKDTGKPSWGSGPENCSKENRFKYSEMVGKGVTTTMSMMLWMPFC